MTIGLDEAGRGALCGPVCAAAVLFNNHKPFSHVHKLADSKSLSPHQRDNIAGVIKEECYFGIGWAYPHEIDKINIHHASLLAMRRAFYTLVIQSNIQHCITGNNDNYKNRIKVLVDGKFTPSIDITHIHIEAVIKGDNKVDEIKAASILAKTSRDNHMRLLDATYPMYGLALHKGYPTPFHKQCIRTYGVTPIYRKSFKC